MSRFSLFAWWHTAGRRARRADPRRPRTERRGGSPLRLERLEDRAVPSTFTVTNLNDSGPGSLRQAVLDANANPGADLIRFAGAARAGTITLTSGELPVTDDVTIAGPGAGRLAVSGNQATRVFDVSAGSVTIAGLTIADGLADSGAPNGSNGGGIYHAAGTLNLFGDVLSGNEANGTAPGDFGYGGAVLNAPGATLDVVRSLFLGNVATGDGKGRGGALFNYGAATVTGSLFAGNQALGGTVGAPNASSGSGGALANLGDLSGATLVVSDSLFLDNLARGGDGTAGAGGAIWDRYANAPPDNAAVITDSVVVSGSTFLGNRAVGGDGGPGLGGDGLGGAILVQSNGASPELGDNATVATLTVSGSVFADNEAVGGGGGGRAFGGAILTNGDLASTTVLGSRFTGNQALGGSGGQGSGIFASDGLAIGGGIANGAGGALVVSDSQFKGNRAVGGEGGNGWGGGIGNFATSLDLADTTATISNTTLVNNEALGGSGGNGQGGALFNGGGAVFGSNASFAFQMTVSDSRVVHNRAVGGDGGDGLGGGVFNDSNATVFMSNSRVTANRAVGGSAGQGIGGGVYTLGTFFVDALTVIKANKATTSNDDVFGTVTPI